MSHTTETNKANFIHNGDYEGEIVIVVGDQRVTVSSEDLKSFIASWIRNEEISRIENMSDNDLFFNVLRKV